MKDRLLASFLFAVVFLTLASTAMAKTWYVNGVSGSNHHSCTSPSTACKTIEHAISLAAPFDEINVAPATYVENLTIGLSIRILGSGASTTIVDGGGVGPVVSISRGNVTLAGMTFRNGGSKNGCCGGIGNGGTLTLSNSIISGNATNGSGAGIGNSGTLTLSNSIISANAVNISCSESCVGVGGGIANSGRLVIDNSTISGNAVNISCSSNNCLSFSPEAGVLPILAPVAP
jgi:nitrous oxidase accessory protein NosD